jgi:hypothetical protein
LDVTAEVITPSGRKDAAISLHVWSNYGRLWVRENEPRQWPACCPERHIEMSGTFCLGVGDPLRPSTPAHARTWWSWLHEYILSQRSADRTGIWPSVRALHHGDAHKHQLELERLSAGTPFEQDVRDALENATGWLAGDLPQPKQSSGRRGRLTGLCPKGCTNEGRPVFHSRCRHRRLVAALVQEELLRRNEEERFWAYFRTVPCCETMFLCPIKQASSS